MDQETVPTLRPSRSQFLPQYRRIEMEMRERIRSGTLAPGQILPGRRIIAKEFGVDVNTFQRAIAPLLKDGTLRVENGRGTFVPDLIGDGDDKSEETIGVKRPATHRVARNGTQSGRGERYLNATVGVIAAYIASDVRMHSLVDSIERRASQFGSKTKFVNIHDNNLPVQPPVGPVDDAIQGLVNEGVDAIILVELYAIPRIVEILTQAVRTAGIPIIYVTWRDAHRPIFQVSYDNHMAAYLAAEHLIECNYDPIVFFAPYSADWVSERIESAQQALIDDHVSNTQLLVLPQIQTPEQFPPRSFSAAFESLGPILANRTNRPGFIAANDYIAQELIRYMSSQNRVLGRDFGVVGFDDDPMSRFVGLTTMRPPLEQLSSEAMRLVQVALQGDMRPVQVRLNSDLIVRTSTSSAVE